MKLFDVQRGSPEHHRKSISKIIKGTISVGARPDILGRCAGNLELLKSAETRQVNSLAQLQGKTRC